MQGGTIRRVTMLQDFVYTCDKYEPDAITILSHILFVAVYLSNQNKFYSTQYLATTLITTTLFLRGP